MNILEYPRLIRPLISIFLCIASLFLSLAGRPTIPHGRQLDMSKFELAWSDEFDGDKLLNNRILQRMEDVSYQIELEGFDRAKDADIIAAAIESPQRLMTLRFNYSPYVVTQS